MLKLRLMTSAQALVVIGALLLTSCGGGEGEATPTLSPDEIQTHAIGTFSAALTQTARAAPSNTPVPTLTPAPTFPPLATSTGGTPFVSGPTVAPTAGCYGLAFMSDVTIPDNTAMTPGQTFTKTWKVKNNGSCPWGAGYVLAYAGYADQMSGQFVAFTEVIQPGQEVEVSVQFAAPDQAGEYLSAWQMRNPAGVTFPEIIFVKILVQ